MLIEGADPKIINDDLSSDTDNDGCEENKEMSFDEMIKDF